MGYNPFNLGRSAGSRAWQQCPRDDGGVHKIASGQEAAGALLSHLNIQCESTIFLFDRDSLGSYSSTFVKDVVVRGKSIQLQ